jgi:hypothetical protein
MSHVIAIEDNPSPQDMHSKKSHTSPEPDVGTHHHFMTFDFCQSRMTEIR